MPQKAKRFRTAGGNYVQWRVYSCGATDGVWSCGGCRLAAFDVSPANAREHAKACR